MKVGMLTASMSSAGGGVASAIAALADGLSGLGDAVEIFASASDPSVEESTSRSGVALRVLPVVGLGSFGFQPGLGQALERAKPDILHLHGLWMYPSVAAMRWSGSPRIISPHGMLDPWALRNSGWKKQIAGAVYERRNLDGAACLHALCKAEALAIRRYGVRGHVAIVPNGVDCAPAERSYPKPEWMERIPEAARILLFIGRIHPKKGLPALLDAFHLLKGNESEGWHLVIAGWDQVDHQSELVAKTQELGLAGRVHFIGPQFGVEKFATFAAADAFILPSLSEGLPMAVLEAWSFAMPVLMTPECNLPEGFDADAALQIGTAPDSIADGLRRLFRMDDHGRMELGARGRRLVSERFEWSRIAKQMHALYDWILGGGEKPGFVEPTSNSGFNHAP